MHGFGGAVLPKALGPCCRPLGRYMVQTGHAQHPVLGMPAHRSLAGPAKLPHSCRQVCVLWEGQQACLLCRAAPVYPVLRMRSGRAGLRRKHRQGTVCRCNRLKLWPLLSLVDCAAHGMACPAVVCRLGSCCSGQLSAKAQGDELEAGLYR